VASVRTRRQRLGQHFLRDARTAEAIAAALDPKPTRVLEIGPGRGALTRTLLARYDFVRGLEVDSALARALPRRLGSPPNLEVLHADALTADLDVAAGDGPWQVAANLPYSIATPILRRLVVRTDLFTCLVVMVQREVAQRLAAPPGGASRGLLSLEIAAYADATLLFTVAPRCFAPPPLVTSAVVRLVLHPPPAPPALLDRALRLAGVGFSHRRKKLVNALAGAADAALVDAWRAKSGVDANARPQELGLEQWLALAATRAGDSAPAEECGRVAEAGRQ
jgi:16S rRNA (adenine1518-N6/adenine1519-N6)-dimethyltransferase